MYAQIGIQFFEERNEFTHRILNDLVLVPILTTQIEDCDT